MSERDTFTVYFSEYSKSHIYARFVNTNTLTHMLDELCIIKEKSNVNIS